MRAACEDYLDSIVFHHAMTGVLSLVGVLNRPICLKEIGTNCVHPRATNGRAI